MKRNDNEMGERGARIEETELIREDVQFALPAELAALAKRGT